MNAGVALVMIVGLIFFAVIGAWLGGKWDSRGR